MRNLKYIELYEAFDSNKLSKTLDYIKDKANFIKSLKYVLDVIDFPYSKITDEYLEYLPYNRAVAKTVALTPEKCDASSVGLFNDKGVEDEYCNNGKIIRRWGKNIRVVDCPVCKGTGIKKSGNNVVRLVKFWFDEEGNYKGVSGVDGVNSYKALGGGGLDDIPAHYNVVKRLTHNEVINLPEGSIVMFDANHKHDIIGYYSNYCFLNNEVSGSGIRNTDIARFSWYVRYQIDYSNPRLLELKDHFGGTFYDYNLRSENKQFVTRGRSGALKDSAFAIILDFHKLRGLKYRRGDLRRSREESKLGATSFMKDSQIKQANIQRYMDSITDLDITDDITNVNRLIYRTIGYRYSLFVMIPDRCKENLLSITSAYFSFLLDSSESRLNNLNYVVKNSIKSSLVASNHIRLNLDSAEKHCPEIKPINNKLFEISTNIYNKVLEYNIDSIYDIEVIYQKILSIKNIFGVNRYGMGDDLRYYISYLNASPSSAGDSPVNYARRLTANKDKIDSYLSKLDRVEPILYKLI